MKAIELSKFKINSSIARGLAEGSWGRGGTSAYKTNRKGAYYYSCSGHGGYIVDSAALSDEECAAIDKYNDNFGRAHEIDILVHDWNGVEMVIGWSNPYSYKSRRYRYDRSYGTTPEWRKYEYYEFEEDCAWAMLEHLTDIRAEGSGWNEVERKAAAEKTFNHYHG